MFIQLLGPVPAPEPGPAEWSQPTADALLSGHHALVSNCARHYPLSPNYTWYPTEWCSA